MGFPIPRGDLIVDARNKSVESAEGVKASVSDRGLRLHLPSPALGKPGHGEPIGRREAGVHRASFLILRCDILAYLAEMRCIRPLKQIERRILSRPDADHARAAQMMVRRGTTRPVLRAPLQIVVRINESH